MSAPKKAARQEEARLFDADPAIDKPLARVMVARVARDSAERAITADVRAARRAGATWDQIAQALNITRQAAHQRYRISGPPAAPQKETLL